MTPILSNSQAERLILDVRVARAARAAEWEGPGGFLVFPTSVVVAVPGRGQSVYPLRTSAEPGTVCRGDGSSTVRAIVDGVTVEGRFWWRFADDDDTDAPPAVYAFTRGGHACRRPDWADQLPRSQCMAPVADAGVRRQRARLVRRGAASEHELLQRTMRVLERCCRGGLRRAIRMRPTLEVADVVQRGMQAAVRLLPVYASPARPPCSWLGMLRLDARRDLHRGVAQLDWLPRDLSEVVACLARDDVPRDADPTVVLGAIIEAAVQHGRTLPRATASQVGAAVRAPRLLPLEGRRAPQGIAARTVGGPDRGIVAIEEQHGAVAAEVARRFGAAPAQAAAASIGDDAAIAGVAALVLASLRLPGEPIAGARRRCRQVLSDHGGPIRGPGGGHTEDPTPCGPDDLGSVDPATVLARLRPTA